MNLTHIAEIELDDEPYQFNLIGVWRDEDTKELVTARDSGCSCPSPWENHTRREDYLTLTDEVWATIKRDVKESRASMAVRSSFINRVAAARKKA